MLYASAATDEETLHLAWRRWLQVYNAMQFLPGMLLSTADGLDAGDYNGLSVVTAGDTAAVEAGDHATLQQAWIEALGQVMEELKSGLTKLARAGAVIPDVGLELVNEKGEVTADAEMAWPADTLAGVSRRP